VSVENAIEWLLANDPMILGISMRMLESKQTAIIAAAEYGPLIRQRIDAVMKQMIDQQFVPDFLNPKVYCMACGSVHDRGQCNKTKPI
jgi:hypothetical protein